MSRAILGGDRGTVELHVGGFSFDRAHHISSHEH